MWTMCHTGYFSLFTKLVGFRSGPTKNTHKLRRTDTALKLYSLTATHQKTTRRVVWVTNVQSTGQTNKHKNTDYWNTAVNLQALHFLLFLFKAAMHPLFRPEKVGQTGSTGEINRITKMLANRHEVSWTGSGRCWSPIPLGSANSGKAKHGCGNLTGSRQLN